MNNDYQIYASFVSTFIAIISAISSYRSYRTNRIESERNKNEFICMQCEDRLDDCYIRVNSFLGSYLIIIKETHDEVDQKVTDRELILYHLETIRHYFNYSQLYDLRSEYADVSILISDIIFETLKMTTQDLMRIRTAISSLKSKVMRQRSVA